VVELLLRNQGYPGGDGGGRHTAPLSRHSIVNPPAPPIPSVNGRFEITNSDVSKRQIEVAREVDLYAQSLGIKVDASYTEITLSYGRQESVHTGMFAPDNSAVVGFVDTTSVYNHIVGGKLQYLHSQLGVGKRILSILEDCPLEIATPRKIIDELSIMATGDSGHDDGKFEYLYPPWTMEDDDYTFLKRKMPDKLAQLIDACDRVKYKATECEMEEVIKLPYAVLLWDDINPLTNKWAQGRNICPYAVRGRGTNPYWVVQQDTVQQSMECGYIVAGHTPVHSEVELKEIITKSKPYLDLLNYITHEKKRIGVDYGYGI